MKQAEKILVGEAADRLGIQAWRLARLYERKLLPEPERIGRYRLVSVDDLPSIREVAIRAGYIKHAHEPRGAVA